MKVSAKVKVNKDWGFVWNLISTIGIPNKSEKAIRKFIYNIDSDSLLSDKSDKRLVSSASIESKVLDWTQGNTQDIKQGSKKYPISTIRTKYVIESLDKDRTQIVFTLNYEITKGALGHLVNVVYLSRFMKNLAKKNLAGLVNMLELHSRSRAA